MINLLTPAAKKQLTKEYHQRLAVIVLCTLFVLEMLTFIFYIPAYYILHSGTSSLAEVLAQKKQLSPASNATVPTQLAAIKDEVTLLTPGTGTSETPPSVLLAQIIAAKPGGIELNAFAYARTGGVINIQLSGTASTREDLLAFQRALRGNPVISDIKYGSSFITQKTDIVFTVTISFK